METFVILALCSSFFLTRVYTFPSLLNSTSLNDTLLGAIDFQSVNSSLSDNRPTRINPFQRGPYIYSGIFFSSIHYHGDNSAYLIDEFGAAVFSQHPAEAHPVGGQRMVVYAGYRGEARITVAWVPSEMGTLTYGQSSAALGRLASAIATVSIQGGALNKHPIQITVSQDGRRRLTCEIAVESGTQVKIDRDKTLSFSGLSYSDRPSLTHQDINGAFAAVLDEERHVGSEQMVVSGWQSGASSQNTQVKYKLSWNFAVFPPKFTHGDIIQLLNSMRAFFQSQTTCYEVYGDIKINRLGRRTIVGTLAITKRNPHSSAVLASSGITAGNVTLASK